MRPIGFSSAALVFVLGLISVGCGDPSHSPTPANGPARGVFSSPPSIAALQPNSVPINSVPFTMEVDGNNFAPDAIVFWNGTPLHTRFVSSQQLFADLTTADLMLSGRVPVYVRTGGLNSNTVTFDMQIN